jgi:hypothetical protein
MGFQRYEQINEQFPHPDSNRRSHRSKHNLFFLGTGNPGCFCERLAEGSFSGGQGTGRVFEGRLIHQGHETHDGTCVHVL